MKYKYFPTIALILLLATACIPAPNTDLSATATQAARELAATQTALAATQTALPPNNQPPTPGTATVLPIPLPPPTTSPTPTAQTQTGQQFIAYVRDGQLLVTDVTNGVQGGTTQYTMEGQGNGVMDIEWSPSGEFVAFVSPVQGNSHIFYIFALGASTPTDLGPGSAPAWSPDSQSLAYIGGTYPDENIWVTTIENPAPRQLTFEANHAWGRPTFTPDGQALIVTQADRMNMGAQANTTFTLEHLALDGSGTRTPLPGATAMEGRLPYDLRFSPNGTRLAFSTSMHYSACASPGAYYVSNPDGGGRQELVSPSVKNMIDPAKERFYVGLSYAWSSTSDGLLISSTVVDCSSGAASTQVIGGPQMSVLRLDGSEGPIIPGMFHSLSTDGTGTLIAGAHYKDFEDLNPMVEIYSAQTGQLVLSLGPGSQPQLQP